MKRYLFYFLFLIVLTSCGPLKVANEAYLQNDYLTTIAECKKVIENDSTRVQAYELLGDAFSRQGELDSAVTAWKSAFQLAEQKDTLSVKLAQAYIVFADTQIVKQRYRNALNFLDISLQYTPDSPGIIEKKADVLCLYKRPDQAREQYQLALTTSTDSLGLLNKIARLDSLEQQSNKVFEQGLAQYTAKKYIRAIKLLDKAIALKPDYNPAHYYYYMAKGKYSYKRGSKKELWESVDEFARAANYDPTKGEPYYWMGMAYHKKDKNEYENAIEQFERAVELEPEGKYAKAAQKKAKELRDHREKMSKFWGK